jgi:hypothetical protein
MMCANKYEKPPKMTSMNVCIPLSPPPVYVKKTKFMVFLFDFTNFLILRLKFFEKKSKQNLFQICCSYSISPSLTFYCKI